MGETARTLGQGADFDFEGKTYTLAPWTYEVQGAYERYLEKEAVAAWRRLSKHLSADEADRAFRGLQQDTAAGVYTFGTELVGKTLESPKHLRHVVYLQLKKNHSEVQPELVDRMAESMWPEVMAALNRANADPNRPAPATATSGPSAPAGA